MNAVIDEDLQRSLSDVLSSSGFKIFDSRDCGLRGKPDEVIFKFAQRQKAVLFSGDLDFSNIIRFPLGTHYGICILRFPNEMSTDLINANVKILLRKLKVGDYKGNLVILSPGKVRIRKPDN
ncbi:hypothetical protein A3D00_00900 [Candidatus Woesebacteria bacterium RIFCSPHIGHO2_02_FULL_38_9]|uniref:DUF5615 domain-containing protein n=1 Tax=Candidatus Woesebacteria bacterium RIFCSPHIGHO2_01_FULL_39_28 TaxID=1802496 RepID=A0A1F7YFH2_9BACT|nr:MAG: hypothetical protein A2627_02230 [Candidatus Woesebacteria bacterium RIFCSPHIGHO2_01_FULL_39_28]OGM31415.1 MAG: hypothetical protein A3D00_00900 [Candidatus Woesebacteria bacterium RIFCSPHIGHO2_02_FULL_38_9]OGM58153.1 MAG: hypothetical protein A3A50_00110 [Candidatus Woesebacteria bacterium RIFCSPLOWO2_01_FULL_38_20]